MLKSCPQYTELYTAWKDTVSDMEKIKDAYIQNPTKTLLEEFESNKEFIMEAKNNLHKSLETPINHRMSFGKKDHMFYTFSRFESDVIHKITSHNFIIRGIFTNNTTKHITQMGIWCNEVKASFVGTLNTSLPYFSQLNNLEIIEMNTPSLPQLPPSITKLTCTQSSFSTLSYLPPSLTYLGLFQLPNLTELPPLPKTLASLECNSCPISSISTLPQSLVHLTCSDCKNISSLPDFPPNLHILDISKCQNLTTLPKLPPTLRVLNISGCKNLTTLPKLPDTLEEFFYSDCDNLSLESRGALEKYLKDHSNFA